MIQINIAFSLVAHTVYPYQIRKHEIQELSILTTPVAQSYLIYDSLLFAQSDQILYAEVLMLS
jgi:hypothetical protein